MLDNNTIFHRCNCHSKSARYKVGENVAKYYISEHFIDAAIIRVIG